MSKPKLDQSQPAIAAGPEHPRLPNDPAALTEKVKELVRLAREQGQLTFEDVNEVLTEEYSTPAYLDQVFAKLRELEIEVVDAAEVDNVNQPTRRKRKRKKCGWTRWMIRCACISSRWARCRC